MMLSEHKGALALAGCGKILAANADYGQSTAESLGLYVKYDWNNYGLQMRNDGITYKWQKMFKPYT